MRNAKDSLKPRADRSIAQAEMAVANDQKSAGLKAAFEIGDGAGKILEAEEGIGTRYARQTKAAMPQHSHTEDRIGNARRLRHVR